MIISMHNFLHYVRPIGHRKYLKTKLGPDCGKLLSANASFPLASVCLVYTLAACYAPLCFLLKEEFRNEISLVGEAGGGLVSGSYENKAKSTLN